MSTAHNKTYTASHVTEHMRKVQEFSSRIQNMSSDTWRALASSWMRLTPPSARPAAAFAFAAAAAFSAALVALQLATATAAGRRTKWTDGGGPPARLHSPVVITGHDVQQDELLASCCMSTSASRQPRHKPH